MKLDHIGIVVTDIEKAKEYYEKHFGFEALSGVVNEPAQKVKVMFINVGLSEMPTIELIQPSGEDSAVYNFLKKTGGGLHHLSYEVDDLDKAIEHLKNQKAVMVGKIYPGAGHNGRRVVWFFTTFKEIVEFIEK